MWFLTYLLVVVGFLLGALLIVHLLAQRKSPASTIAWLMTIIVMPYVGVPLYLLLGGRKIRKMAEQKRALYLPESDVTADPTTGFTQRLLASLGAPRTTTGNKVELLGTGETAYGRIIDLIEEAHQRIHITTFILGRDEVGQSIVSHLSRRARDGIEVRLVVDALGSFWSSRSTVKPLLQAGGMTARFMPMLTLPTNGSANLRNHRKLIVADGKRAIVGGMNLAKQYMGPVRHPKRWRDIALHIEGPAVHDIEEIFRLDWNFAAGKKRHLESYESTADAECGDGSVQVIGSGPDVPGDPLYDAKLTMMFQARERIWIATPYFIPDQGICRALILAVRRGVDVRVLIPNRSNHLPADWARAAYLREFADVGGQVYRYPHSMMHGKVTIFDHSCAIVGSANVDMRSLFLNYELNLFVYSKPEIETVAEWVQALMIASRTGVPKPTRLGRVGENFGHLIAPLL